MKNKIGDYTESIIVLSNSFRIPTVYIDPREHVKNQLKHNQTCAKNRKKRRKKHK
jgi:hypothetical protein